MPLPDRMLNRTINMEEREVVKRVDASATSVAGTTVGVKDWYKSYKTLRSQSITFTLNSGKVTITP